jgi:hypothetical protein
MDGLYLTREHDLTLFSHKCDTYVPFTIPNVPSAMSLTILYSPNLFHGASGSGGATGSILNLSKPKSGDKPLWRCLPSPLKLACILTRPSQTIRCNFTCYELTGREGEICGHPKVLEITDGYRHIWHL